MKIKVLNSSVKNIYMIVLAYIYYTHIKLNRDHKASGWELNPRPLDL